MNKARYERQMFASKRLNESWEKSHLKHIRKEYSLRVRELCFTACTYEERMQLRKEYSDKRESGLSKIKNASKRARKDRKYISRMLREQMIYDRLEKMCAAQKRDMFNEEQDKLDEEFAATMLDVSSRVHFNGKMSYKACSGMRYIELEANYRPSWEDVLALEWMCDGCGEYVWIYSSAKKRHILVPLTYIQCDSDLMNLSDIAECATCPGDHTSRVQEDKVETGGECVHTLNGATEDSSASRFESLSTTSKDIPREREGSALLTVLPLAVPVGSPCLSRNLAVGRETCELVRACMVAECGRSAIGESEICSLFRESSPEQSVSLARRKYPRPKEVSDTKRSRPQPLGKERNKYRSSKNDTYDGGT